MSDKITYADQVAISHRLRDIAAMIQDELGKATGGKRVPFSLYTWAGQRTQYVSSAYREDVKKGMRELLEKWDQDDGPFHQVKQEGAGDD